MFLKKSKYTEKGYTEPFMPLRWLFSLLEFFFFFLKFPNILGTVSHRLYIMYLDINYEGTFVGRSVKCYK